MARNWWQWWDSCPRRTFRPEEEKEANLLCDKQKEPCLSGEKPEAAVKLERRRERRTSLIQRESRGPQKPPCLLEEKSQDPQPALPNVLRQSEKLQYTLVDPQEV
jgi:hypothetical protein